MNIEEFNNAIKTKVSGKYDIKDDVDSYGNSNFWVKLQCKKDIEVVAKAIKAYKGRCVVATAYKNDDDTHTVVYHFDLDGTIVNAELHTDDATTVSVTPILPSANWAEREMREMFGVEPIGHPCKDRLFLDYSIAKGVLNDYIPLSKMQLGVSDSDVMWQKVKEGAKA